MGRRNTAVAVLVLLLAGCGRSVDLPQPAPQMPDTTGRSADPPLEWMRAETGDLSASGSTLQAVASIQGILVLAGWRGGEVSGAFIWWSETGDDWHHVPGDFADYSIEEIVPSAEGLVAIGHHSTGLFGLDSEPAAWASPDGKEWTRIGNLPCPSPSLDTLDAATGVRGDWVFIGGYRPQVCVGATGSVAPDPLSGVAPLGSIHLNGITANDNSAVIVGTTAWTNETWTDEHVAATWFSGDGGHSWRETRIVPSAATLRAVASDGSRFLAVGTDPHETGETVDFGGELIPQIRELPLLLTSSDGARWEAGYLPSARPGGANDIVFTGDAYAAAGWSLGPPVMVGFPSIQPTIWYSTDGLEWTTSEIPAFGEEARRIAVWGDRFAVITDDGIWLSDP